MLFIQLNNFLFFPKTPYFTCHAKIRDMNLDQFAQEVRLLIAQGETQEAIERLLQLYNQAKGEYYDELIVVASHYKILRDKIMAGTLDADDASVQTNAINHSLLQLIDHIDQDKPLLRYFKQDDNKIPQLPDFKLKTKKSNRNLLIGIGIGAVLLVAVFLIGQQFGGSKSNLAEPAVPEETQTAGVEEAPKMSDRAITNVQKPKPKETQPTPSKPEVKAEVEKFIDNQLVSPVKEEENLPTETAKSLDSEPNNTIAQAIALSFPASQPGSIASASDRDHYKIRLKEGEQVNVLLETTAGNLNPILEILDDSGRSLQRLGARDGRITTFHRARTSGVYYMRIYGRLRTTGDYIIKMRVGEE